MSPLLNSFTVIFMTISVGFFCGKKRLFQEAQLEGLEIFLFNIALPFYLFDAVLKYDIQELLHYRYLFCYLLSFLSIATLSALYFKKRTSRSTLYMYLLTSGYGNTAIYALPVISFMLGDPKAAILANLIQVILIQPLFLMAFTLEDPTKKKSPYTFLKTISTPLIFFPIIGILLSLMQYTPPAPLLTCSHTLGASASSLALFVFGIALSKLHFSKALFKKEILLTVLLKNLVHPLIAFSLGKYVFHLETYWLQAITIIASAPPAFILYLIAKKFSKQATSVNSILSFSSLLSLVFLVFILPRLL